jgi:adenylate cyclase
MRSMIAGVAMLLAVCSQWLGSPNDSFFVNEWLRDQFIRMHASDEPESRMILVDIDEASLTAIGPWPWPRQRIAELIENLLGPYEAHGVALDLVFPERADAEGDLRLAMLAEHGPVVLAQAFDYEKRQLPIRVGQISGGTPAPASAQVPVASGYIGNHAGFIKAAHVGNIGFVPDKDGTIRRLPMLTAFDGKIYPTLSLALMNCCASDKGNIVAGKGIERIPFRRAWSAYTVIPAAQLLNQSVPPELIAGRLVIIGSSSLGLTDRVATPLNPSTAGMMVHAAQLSTLLDNQAGLMPSAWPGRAIATLFAILVAALAAYTFPRLQAVANVTLLGGASVAWLALAYVIAPHDPYFSPAGPLISNLFLLAVAVPFDWQVTQSKSRKLLDTLRQYVAQSVVDELLRRDLEDPLAPQQLNVTTLIADMEGYTHQVEMLTMEEAAQLTRDFLDCLTRPVIAMHGTLDKYTGDGLVAFWGAPLPIEDHADLALDAAQEIVQEVQRFSKKREQMGLPPLRVRIGIESGVAMAGDFGTSFRSIYTAVGDSVNVASRLEQMAREFPYSVIVGQGTVDAAKRHRFLLLGERVLRGKEKATTLFTLDPAHLEQAA